jgi:hypothetical protein
MYERRPGPPERSRGSSAHLEMTDVSLVTQQRPAAGLGGPKAELPEPVLEELDPVGGDPLDGFPDPRVARLGQKIDVGHAEGFATGATGARGSHQRERQSRQSHPGRETQESWVTDHDGQEPWMTVEDAADYLCCSIKTIYRHAAALGGRKLGNQWLFKASIIDGRLKAADPAEVLPASRHLSGVSQRRD